MIPEAEPVAEQPDGLVQIRSRTLPGLPDDHGFRPGLLRRRQLFSNASGRAGVLGHKVFRAHLPEGGKIHFFGEGALHGKNVGGLQSRLPAEPQRVLHGQHPGVDPFRKIGQGGKFVQFLAAGGQENRALRPGKVRDRFLHTGDTHVSRPVSAGTQKPVAGGAGGGTGGGNVLRHHIRIGVGGVYHQVEPLPTEQRFHFFLRQPPGGNGQVLPPGQQGLPVFRGYADRDPGIVFRQKFRQKPPLGGSGKYTQLTHSGILWG